MAIDAPVAFFVFNRPDVTRRVFAEIRRARPARLLIVADGPRCSRDGEAQRCAEVRALVDQVDWPCEVERLYAEVNLGCRLRVSSGLDWVFSRVDRAIILEDDCLPDPSFFAFCTELLERFADDRRVMHISGTSFLRQGWPTSTSYIATRMPFVWGWATWRRAWNAYDVDVADWPTFRNNDGLTTWFANPQDRAGWTQRIDDVFSKRLDTWDIQWAYACLRSGGVSLMSTNNLVSNLGFGAEATHTRVWSSRAEMALRPLTGPTDHPQTLAFDPALEEDLQKRLYRPPSRWISAVRRLGRRIIVGAQSLTTARQTRRSAAPDGALVAEDRHR